MHDVNLLSFSACFPNCVHADCILSPFPCGKRKILICMFAHMLHHFRIASLGSRAKCVYFNLLFPMGSPLSHKNLNNEHDLSPAESEMDQYNTANIKVAVKPFGYLVIKRLNGLWQLQYRLFGHCSLFLVFIFLLHCFLQVSR